MFRSKSASQLERGDDSSTGYDIVEEEVVETLSEDDMAIPDFRTEYEEVVEEEVVEEEEIDERTLLPLISEEEETEVEYVEEFSTRSVHSATEFVEVEVDEVAEQPASTDGDETIVEEVDDDSSYIDLTIREDDGDLFEIPTAEELMREFSISKEKDDDTSPEGSSDEEDEGETAEELSEAIEYVLRQEKAVSKFILTEEQAEKMANLPIKVMKVIVDHLETCDNAGTPIDWDFLLKIVLPFCDGAADDSDDEDHGITIKPRS